MTFNPYIFYTSNNDRFNEQDELEQHLKMIHESQQFRDQNNNITSITTAVGAGGAKIDIDPYYYVDVLPSEILSTNPYTVFSIPGGYKILKLPSDNSVNIELFGAKANTESTTNIQNAFDTAITDRRIKRVTATDGIYYISNTINLNYNHRDITIDFKNAIIKLVGQTSNIDTMFYIWVHGNGISNRGPSHPGYFKINIDKITMDGGLKTITDTGTYDELYIDQGIGSRPNRTTNYTNVSGITVYGDTGVTLLDGLKDAVFKNIIVQNLGGTGVNLYAKCTNLTIGTIIGNRIASHLIGAIGNGENVNPDDIFIDGNLNTINIDTLYVENGYTIFDFSSLNKDRINQRSGWVNINKAIGHNMFNRTKIHGNWGVNINYFEMTHNQPMVKLTDLGGNVYNDNTCWFRALDVTNKYIQYLNINSMCVDDCPAGIFVDNTVSGSGLITINNLTGSNCYRSISGYDNVIINNCILTNCREGVMAKTVNNVTHSHFNHDYWARTIKNGVSSSGYSDTVLYKATINQGTSVNVFNTSSPSSSYYNNISIIDPGSMICNRNVSYKNRTNNIATLTTFYSHSLQDNDIVTIASMDDTTFNTSSAIITVLNTSSFSYINSGSDVGITSVSAGSVTPSFSVTTVNSVFFVDTSQPHVTMSNFTITESNPLTTYYVANVSRSGSMYFTQSNFANLTQSRWGTTSQYGNLYINGIVY